MQDEDGDEETCGREDGAGQSEAKDLPAIVDEEGWGA